MVISINNEESFGKCMCIPGHELWGSYYEYFFSVKNKEYFQDESKCQECGMCDSRHYILVERGNKTKNLKKFPKCCEDYHLSIDYENEIPVDKDINDDEAYFEWACSNCSYVIEELYKYSHSSQCNRNVLTGKELEEFNILKTERLLDGC